MCWCASWWTSSTINGPAPSVPGCDPSRSTASGAIGAVGNTFPRAAATATRRRLEQLEDPHGSLSRLSVDEVRTNQLKVDHLNAVDLVAFGLGRLDEGHAVEVEAHLATCETCRSAVDAAPTDPFVAKVQAACLQTQQDSLLSSGGDSLRDPDPPSSPRHGGDTRGISEHPAIG